MTVASCSTTDRTPTLQLPLIALDIGKRRIGVAVCDRLGLAARGIACLHRRDSGWPQQALKLAAEYGSKGVVVGLPKNMDGTEGPQAADCRSQAELLSTHTELPIRLYDERLSTWSAKERLRAQGLSEKKVAERVDQTAAAVILEDFLAAQKMADRKTATGKTELPHD